MVYNQEKTQILDEYDLSLGYLVNDTLVIHHNEVKGVKGKGHYEVIKEYDNGGERCRMDC